MQAGFEPVDAAPPAPGDGDHGWRFVIDHARVLEAIAQDPTTRQRDIARIAGVTERTVSRCATSGTAIAPSGS